MKIAASIFKTLFLCLCIIANTHLAYAQTASILPQGKTQFLDNNGKPLTSGTVDFYIPSTTTRKTTWQNSAETVANSNPVVLDAGGRAIIYGDGSYRQVVKDRLGNVIWDQVTSSTGSGSGGSTATGDGDLVGTIKPWAGMTAPNQYVFTYGQEISRTTYSALFTAITSSQSVFCTSGSPTLTGLSDTTNFWVGASVEVSCLAAGFSTIISKTSSSITLASNANVSTNVTAIIFPWGRGNGTTTFNVPDLRGFAIAGNNNMGGVASSRLTTTYFGSADPNSIGAAGGNQSRTFSISEIPGHNHPVFLNDPTHTHGHNANSNNSSSSTGGGAFAIPDPIAATINSASTGVTIRDTSGLFGTTNQTNLSGGGIAVSATLGNIGSGYTNGSQTITVSGGTCTTQPQFTITVAGNVFTGTPALLTAGSCTVAPNNPAATTGGGGTGGTLNVTYSAQPISLIQPTKTSNYIIKITPDTNSATASGVTSLGGMTGDIACGSGLLCTGNNISVVSGATTIIVDGTPITGGVNRGLLYNNNNVVGNLSELSLDVRKYAVGPKTSATVCNGSGDDTATIQAAINAADSNVGGTIEFPAGNCVVASPGLDFTNKGNIVLHGQGNGRNLSSSVTSIDYTSATGSLAKLDGAFNVTFDGMRLSYSNGAYNGDLTDIRQVSGTLNTLNITFKNCFMYGASNTAASFIRMGSGGGGSTATLSTKIDNCFFQGAIQNIKGGTNSNNVSILKSWFNQGSSTSHIGIQGEGWVIQGNTFEPSLGTVANNITVNGATSGLLISGNTFNDGSTGTLIDLSGGVVTGANITGNDIQGGTTSINAGSAVAIIISGNFLSFNGVCGTVVNSATFVTLISNSGVPATSLACSLPSGTYMVDKNDGGFSGYWLSGIKLGTPLEATQGGTGTSSYSIGDILFANTTTTLSKLSDIATGNALISGGVGVAPAWGKIGISTHVSGLGTGIATALGVNVGTAGSPVINGGALGSPSSAGTIPAFTLGGTISGGGNQLNNIIIGSTTPLAGTFTNIIANAGSTALAPITIEKAGGDLFAMRYNSSNARFIFGAGGGSGTTFMGSNMVFASVNDWNYDKTGAAWWIGNLPGGANPFYLCASTGTAGGSIGTSTLNNCGFSLTTAGNPLVNGQFIISNNATSGGGVPTIPSGNCGTGTNGTISGINQTGLVTIGAAATTTCTILFSGTLAAAPIACIIFPANATAAATGTTVARVSSISTSQWVITGSALANSNYYYHCI